MVSLGLIIGGLLVFLIVVAVAIYLLIRITSNGTTGSTGSTGSTGNACASCTVVNNACNAPSVLKIGFGVTGDIGCSTTCRNTSSNISVSGCVAPQCNSKYCTPQASLYTNLNSDGTFYNFCSSGIGTAFPVTNCNQSLTAEQLGSLPMQTTSVINSTLNPIFITTTKLSIYQTTQPIATGGIPQQSIEVNLTDPTVITNPYVLYMSDGIVSFQRIQDILTLGNVNNAIWVYNTDNNILNLFQHINQNFAINNLRLQGASTSIPYEGPNEPCGVSFYMTPQLSANNVYDPNSGLFYMTQNSLSGPARGPVKVVSDGAGNFLASADVENFPTPTPPCPSSNYARWYGISAINQFLGK